MIKIINSNILEFESDTKYHAIISDPPYGLAFMNKKWDNFRTPLEYQKWVTEWSTRLLDTLYPGAICAFFGGTRTYHRLASGLEDSGYEIFDSLIWCYGSGFPKSYNISKGIDKSLGLEREIVGYENPYKDGSKRNIQTLGNDITYHNSILKLENGMKPIYKVNNIWNGYGTALKPAYEPIVLCRKPLDKGGYVNSVLKYGTSGLNIDGGRIDTIDNLGRPTGNTSIWETKKQVNDYIDNSNGLGRFPANFGLICTCEKEPCECVQLELDNQSGDTGNGYRKNKSLKTNQHQNITYGKYNDVYEVGERGFNDKGGASRFFYTAKASSKERELGLEELELKLSGGMQGTLEQTLLTGSGNIRNNMRYNNHPTVKPIKLIEYLAKLLLPPIVNSSILIPFSGVGSEMIGCHLAGWQNITGIEIDENYVNIANKRLDYWTQFDDYESAMKAKSNPQISYEDTLVAK